MQSSPFFSGHQPQQPVMQVMQGMQGMQPLGMQPLGMQVMVPAMGPTGMPHGMQQPQQNYLEYLNANSSNNAELQNFLDKFIEKMIYRILRYINKFYLQEIIGESDIKPNSVNNIRKFIIYLWIIFSFHSNIKDSLIDFDSYKQTFMNYFKRWFKINRFARRTTLKSDALKQGYLDNQYLPVFDRQMHEDKYQRLIIKLELDTKLIHAIYAIMQLIRINNYKLLSIMFDSKYKVMRNNDYNLAVKVGNFIVDYSIIYNTNYGENVIDHINRDNIIDITNYTKIENIYFDTDMNPIPVKIIDFIPVKQIDNRLVSIYYDARIIVADITEDNLRVNENISTEIKQYFKGIVYRDTTEYKHEFNSAADPAIEASQLQFPLYVIKE